MHLNIERRFVIYLLLTMLAFMLLLFGGLPPTLCHDGRNWENIAAKEIERALAAAGGGGEQGHKAAAQPATRQAASAAENYKGVCVPCHGEKGDGNGAAAVALNPKPANFTGPCLLADA